jgi:two-component sensor histidine kinase
LPTGDCQPEKLISAYTQLVELTLERRRAREQQEIIIRELQHRMGNLFASVGAIAQLSANSDMDVLAFQTAFQGRLTALASAHSMMLAESGADLPHLLKNVLEPQ